LRPTVTRYWRWFFGGLAALAVAGALAVLLAPDLAGLYLLALYCVPTNSIFPLPHEPGVLYFAQQYDPIWIALVATASSVIMSFADYAMVGAWMRHPKLGAVQHTRIFKWAVRWMRRFPFAIVALFSAVPFLPISVIRILAPASGYSIWRYIAAQVVGRLPRFFALAWLGATIHFPPWALVAIFALTVGMLWVSSRGPVDEVEDEHEVALP
jgi:membrane protein YqaA with SNARE-associated domain